MIDDFIARVPLLNDNELPGPQVWNELVQFIRGIKSASPFIVFSPNQPTGVNIQLDVLGILDMFRPTETTFQASLEYDKDDNQGRKPPYLSITGGTVRLPDVSLSVAAYRERIKKDEETRAWLRITHGGAQIRIGGNEFPDFIDDENGRINWPLCQVEKCDEDNGKEEGIDPLACTPYKITMMHSGDVNIVTTPVSWLDGYTKEEKMARVIVDGEETFAEIGDCDEEEEDETAE